VRIDDSRRATIEERDFSLECLPTDNAFKNILKSCTETFAT
jgi:hypothetical protein